MTNREFHGDQFWRFMQQDYDFIRQWRKNLGVPTETDRALMPAMKAFESFYKKMGIGSV